MKQYFIIVAAILTVLFIIGIGKTIDEGTKAGMEHRHAVVKNLRGWQRLHDFRENNHLDSDQKVEWELKAAKEEVARLKIDPNSMLYDYD